MGRYEEPQHTSPQTSTHFPTPPSTFPYTSPHISPPLPNTFPYTHSHIFPYTPVHFPTPFSTLPPKPLTSPLISPHTLSHTSPAPHNFPPCLPTWKLIKKYARDKTQNTREPVGVVVVWCDKSSATKVSSDKTSDNPTV